MCDNTLHGWKNCSPLIEARRVFLSFCFLFFVKHFLAFECLPWLLCWHNATYLGITFGTLLECVHLNFLQFLGSCMHGKTNKQTNCLTKFNGNHFHFQKLRKEFVWVYTRYRLCHFRPSNECANKWQSQNSHKNFIKMKRTEIPRSPVLQLLKLRAKTYYIKYFSLKFIMNKQLSDIPYFIINFNLTEQFNMIK